MKENDRIKRSLKRLKKSKNDLHKTQREFNNGDNQIIAVSAAFFADKSDEAFNTASSMILKDATGKYVSVILPPDFMMKFLIGSFGAFDSDKNTLGRKDDQFGRNSFEVFSEKFRAFINPHIDEVWLREIYDKSAVSIVSDTEEAINIAVAMEEKREDEENEEANRTFATPRPRQ